MSINIRNEIEKARRIEDRLRRALFVVGLWTELLKPLGTRPIVVGGTAVEFYSFGAYMTYDLDLVCTRRAEALAQLERLGFEQTESLRHWYHEELGLVIEIPDNELAGSHEHVVQVDVGPYSAYIIGIEDLILDRLRAYVHWQSTQDGEWTRRLLSLHRHNIDWPYLEKSAAEEGLADALGEMSRR